MSSLMYIVVRGLKNRFLEVLRKPQKLIVYLVVIGLLVFVFITSMLNRAGVESFIDLVWLKGIVFALILLFFVIAIQKGLQSGDVIFDMSDVNFLFVSPLRPQSILLYGVVRMMGMSLMAGFFILFQGHSLANFGIGFGGVMLILLGFMLAVSFMQIISLLIYSLTNGRSKRKMAVRIAAVLVFVPMAATALSQILQSSGDMLGALEALLRSPVTAWTPVVGWASEGTIAFISGDLATGFLFYSVIIAAGTALMVYILRSNPDYYEDVLVASETAFERKRALAEAGVQSTDAMSNRKIKVSATGIGGSGSSAFFYKHIRESFRINRFGLWGLASVITIAGTSVFALFMRSRGADSGDGGNIVTLLAILMWIQVFMVGTGRGLKELYSHYIYMVPESSFKKIVWSNLEIVFKVLVEAVLAFGAAGIILQEPLLVIVAVIATYSLFALLLLGVNYLSMRWTDADMSHGILIILYIIGVIVIMLPGLIPAFIVGNMAGILAGLSVLAAWELLAALGCFALSKGILHKCDMPVVKTGQ